MRDEIFDENAGCGGSFWVFAIEARVGFELERTLLETKVITIRDCGKKKMSGEIQVGFITLMLKYS